MNRAYINDTANVISEVINPAEQRYREQQKAPTPYYPLADSGESGYGQTDKQPS